MAHPPKVPFLLLIAAMIVIFPLSARAHEGSHDSHGDAGSSVSGEAGLDEKIGGMISGDAAFSDEKGTRRVMKDLIIMPTLVLPVYFTCKSSCGIMMGNLARTVNDVPLELGKDYRIVTFSFDVGDSPATAREARDNHLAVLKSPPPPGAWTFLSGGIADIMKLTGSIGFSFTKAGNGVFAHPNTLVVLSRDGKIIRYLGGPNFLPFDITMALTEAEKGTPSVSIRKILSYCFSYESEKKTYTLRGVKIISGILLLGMGGLLFYFLRKKPSDK